MPRKSKRPIAIDLFSGAGGMSLGFEQAGFDVVAAVEIDPVHASIHKYNFPHCTVIPKSVIDLTGKEIRRKSGVGNRSIDVVFGGAPCQGFSLIGQRAIDDPRNQLVKEFVRLVVELNASYFVFENVKGLAVGKHKAFLTELIEEFEQAGYELASSTNPKDRILNAAKFGVPQDRHRLFLIGAKKGAKVPTYPSPTTNPRGSRTLDEELALGPSCGEALSDLSNLDDFDELKVVDEVRVKAPRKNTLSKYAMQMRCLTNDAWHCGYPREWDNSLLTSSLRTEHTEISKRRFRETTEGTVEPVSRFYKLSADGISNTLRAGTDSARGAFTSPRPIHYEHDRCVSVREMARLHGFPDWFRFHSTKWHGARQIGNAVPPPLARAVALQVMDALQIAGNQPTEPISLGAAELLRMDLTQAAAYWGIENPIGRRNMKSGAKKRKQEDIERERLEAAE